MAARTAPSAGARTVFAMTLALAALAATAPAQETVPVAPAPAPTPGIAPAGSTVAGVDVSGQDAATALATVNAAFAQPIVIRIGERVFKITNAQVEEIAKIKMPDLNCFDVDAAIRSVRGTARSMGVDVV